MLPNYAWDMTSNSCYNTSSMFAFLDEVCCSSFQSEPTSAYTDYSTNESQKDADESSAISASSMSACDRGMFKWSHDEEIKFFTQVVVLNGCKYTKMINKFSNKTIKSLNNKWQLEKRRTVKHGILHDWKTVIVEVITRYFANLMKFCTSEQSEIRESLCLIISNIKNCNFDGFDKYSHEIFASDLLSLVRETLGVKYCDLIGIPECAPHRDGVRRMTKF